MNVLLFFIAVFGVSMLIVSQVRVNAQDKPTKSSSDKRDYLTCNNMDYLFQKQFHDGIIENGKKTRVLQQQISDLIQQNREINDAIKFLHEELESEDDIYIKYPSNFETMDYLFGEKKVRHTFEDRHRGGIAVPNFETPSFVSEM